MPGNARGAASRRIAQYGRRVELVNESRTIDDSTDWDDAAESETRIEAPVQFGSPSDASREHTESGVSVEADYAGYVAYSSLEDAVDTGETDANGDPIYEDFPIETGTTPTRVEGGPADATLQVVQFYVNANGVYELLLERI